MNRTDIFDGFKQQIHASAKSHIVSQSANITSVLVGRGNIIVEKGDITKQTVDIIVGSSSSTALLEGIFRAAGSAVRTEYMNEQKNDPNAVLISTIPGSLSLSTVIVHVISYRFTSIAFPAIGCGKHGCSVDVVVKTMVKEIKNQLTLRNYPLTVKFVIEASQQGLYDEFCRQVLKKENRNYTKIVRIERIQNEQWYLQYFAHSEGFKKRLHQNTEKILYHGCPEIAANSIIKKCFDRNFSGVNGTAYGNGVYFSSNASYSHTYAPPNTKGKRCMFVVRVLVDGQHIFVTYHDAQAYAEYLIIYKAN
ncbi:hypothetical protein I4U23_017820 [Adineta vaga]|nr:hypothetical protein I4U23_017820 [Adineta vaga]